MPRSSLILFLPSQALFHKQSGLRRYRSELAVSYMEIYKDEVYDLLVNRENVRVSCKLHDYDVLI